MSIPLFSESGEFLQMCTDNEARLLIYNHEVKLIRDRKGNDRRLILLAREDRPLRGSAREQAFASYAGAVKYTYVEHFDSAPPAHALKRYNQKTGAFEKWQQST